MFFREIKNKIRGGRPGHDERRRGASGSTSALPTGPPPPYATSAPQSTPTATKPKKPKNLGLFCLYESSVDTEEDDQYAVDVVAVHGLNGDAFKTWTHSNGTLWLQSILPKFLPGCRVYTYGYPSQVFFSKSSATVREFARGLLTSVRDVQERNGEKRRPIILVCHSLGGIVCKQALVFAHQDDKLYGSFLGSIIGITFLGTPHRGSQSASLGSIVATIADVCTQAPSAGLLLPGPVRTDLLKNLERDAKPLEDLAEDVRNRFENMTIVSFYETEPLCYILPKYAFIVNKASARVGIAHEEIRPLYANHRDICRFEGETNDCRSVCEAIRRIANQQQNVRQQLARATTPTSLISFNEREKSCMKLFNPFDMADYRRRLPLPIEGTGQWIREHPLFMSWFEGAGNSLLWLTGHPGCGKTMLSYSLARQLEETSQHVLVSFCDDKVNLQKDAKAILISLIAQLVQRNRKMVQHVRRVFEIQGSSMLLSFSALWTVFERIIKDLNPGSIYIIVDALDECERSSCDDFLNSIRELVGTPTSEPGSSTLVKFLLTSRPALGQAYIVRESLEKHHLPIDQGQPGYEKDIHVFIQQKVEEITVKRRCPEEVKSFLVQALSSRADQSFLWIHMVIAKLEQSFLASANDFQDIIGRLPPDLETMYLGFFTSIPLEHQESAMQLLQLLLASTRPLQLEEINLAFTIKPTYDSSEALVKNCQSDMEGAILGILGPLVRISDSTVSLVHQTAKDFLVANKSEAAARSLSDACPRLSFITLETSALRMASACIQYLLLKDFSRNSQYPANPSEGSSSDFSSDSGSDSDSANPYLDLPGLAFFEDEGNDDIPGAKTGLVFHEPEDLDAEISQALASKYAFYSYSSLHWAEHLALSEDQAPSQVKEAALLLLNVEKKSCRNWLHFYRSEVSDSSEDIHSGSSPLMLAAYFNLRVTMIGILEKDGSSQLDKDQALLLGAKAGHSRIVTVLLDANADPNYHIVHGQTALTEAAAHGQIECVVLLLEAERDGLPVKEEHVGAALELAASNGHHDIVKRLLNWHDGKVDKAGHLGGLPLRRAACAGHVPIVATLCKDKRIEVNYRDTKGRTPISWAAGDGMDEVLKYLLKQRSIDANLEDNQGRTPLSWAAGNGHAVAVNILAKSKKKAVGKNKADHNGRTPLSWACGQGQEAAVRVLLNHGCTGVNEGDVDGWTPLAWATQQNRPGVVEALIDAGVKDLEKPEGSRTVLSWAVEYGHLEVVRVLLRRGADPKSAAHQIPDMLGRKKDDLANELSLYMNRKLAV